MYDEICNSSSPLTVFIFSDHPINSNGTSPHITNSWTDYSDYHCYSSQAGYYTPNQDIHSSSGHLPTVLPDPQHEYITTSLTSPLISPTPMYNSPKPELEAIMPTNARYPENSYCPNNWAPPNTSYHQNYNYNTTNSNQQYPPVVAIYPHLYSTVNQNQIHVHLHGSSENLDKFFTSTEALSGTTPRTLEMPPVAATEVVAPITDPLLETEREQPNDPSNVWRPY
ncbi:hypothetical protein HHI36_014884 [Cryptolaemus montrouzieri]|uniref:Uncharacterized protein n=1 Tax=Cryptolaemus montrouzieri TaxID=559131 RepID=A0ABD2N4W9_9CUCU